MERIVLPDWWFRKRPEMMKIATLFVVSGKWRWLSYGLIVLLLTAVCLSHDRTSTASAQNSLAKKRPNIVFIISDDHAAQAISTYGSKLIKTPNIDRLANEGMKF